MRDSIQPTPSVSSEPSADIPIPAHEAAGSSPGLTCEVKHLEETNDNGRRQISAKSDTKDENEEDHEDEYAQYAMVSIQVFSASDDKNGKRGKPIKKKLRINSPHICNALAQVLKATGKCCLSFYGSQILLPDGGRNGFESPPVEVVSPFTLLYHCQEKLRDWYDERDRSEEERKHLGILFDYLSKEPGSAAIDWLDSGRITFDMLRHIFRPNEYVFQNMGTSAENDRWQILWVRGAYVEERSWLRDPSFVLDCLHTASDGKIIGKTSVTLRISEAEFPGKGEPKAITALSVFPLKFLDDGGREYTNEAAQRSIEYRKLHSDGAPIRRYTGVCEVYVQKPKPDESYWASHTIVSRVIVDHQAFKEEFPEVRMYVEIWGDEGYQIAGSVHGSDKSSGKEGEKPNLPDDRDILCPPYVYGYSLGTRQWCRFFLSCLSSAAWDTQVWSKRLILPLPEKDLLRSMISKHTFPEDADAVRNEDALKGKGLVIVLHGPPGTGKTLTAEAAAEETKKPLLHYPVGELGSNLKDIQDGVRRIVRYASRWKAVLLIDEADVFLESRESAAANVERNALVTVFLRQLEYSQGIIFLTSNRAQRFDPAIESRVHLSLYYAAPDEETRRKLWGDQFDSAPSGRLHADFDKKKAVDLVASRPLNGREISNMFNSAMTLATNTREKKLTMEHIEQVVEVWDAASKHSANRVEEKPGPEPTMLERVDCINRFLTLFVLLCLVVAFSAHLYQVVVKGKRDIVILYREAPQVAHGYM